MKIYRRTYNVKGRLCTAKTWSLLYSIGGVRFHQSLHTRDRRAAELIAGDIVRRAELKRAGIVDPFGESTERSVAQHLKDFLTTIRAHGVVEKYLIEREGHLHTFFETAKVRKIADIDLTRASHWLNEEQRRGLSPRSVNARRAALKQFTKWLVTTRRAAFDPLETLRVLNEEADRRRVRRALTPEEAGRLVEAARTRAIARAGRLHPKAKPERRERAERTLAKMTRLGEARALVYLLALGTGLRRGELRRLRWCDVDLERGRVTVTAASAKSRREQSVDLHPRLVETLASARPADASPTDTVVPARAFPSIRTFDADLEAAGIEKTDDEGRVVDFHALRHTFVTWLARSGASMRTTQALARHASVTTTERYCDLHLFDLRGVVGRLPLPSSTLAWAAFA
jgi:integrase